MPQCQFLFSAVFGFRKAVLQISSESDETNCKVPIFPYTFQKSERETKGGSEAPSPPMAWVGPLPRHQVGSEPRGSTDAAPSPIYSSRRENPKTPSHYSRKYPLPPPPSTLTRGVPEPLPGTLPKRGIITGGLYIAMPASGVMCE